MKIKKAFLIDKATFKKTKSYCESKNARFIDIIRIVSYEWIKKENNPNLRRMFLSTYPYSIVSIRLEKYEFDHLERICKKYKITLGDLLHVAFNDIIKNDSLTRLELREL